MGYITEVFRNLNNKRLERQRRIKAEDRKAYLAAIADHPKKSKPKRKVTLKAKKGVLTAKQKNKAILDKLKNSFVANHKRFYYITRSQNIVTISRRQAALRKKGNQCTVREFLLDGNHWLYLYSTI